MKMPDRRAVTEITDDEITGVVEEDFYDEERTPVSGLLYHELEEVGIVVRAIAALLRRYTGERRKVVRAQLLSAVGEDAS